METRIFSPWFWQKNYIAQVRKDACPWRLLGSPTRDFAWGEGRSNSTHKLWPIINIALFCRPIAWLKKNTHGSHGFSCQQVLARPIAYGTACSVPVPCVSRNAMALTLIWPYSTSELRLPVWSVYYQRKNPLNNNKNYVKSWSLAMGATPVC